MHRSVTCLRVALYRTPLHIWDLLSSHIRSRQWKSLIAYVSYFMPSRSSAALIFDVFCLRRAVYISYAFLVGDLYIANANTCAPHWRSPLDQSKSRLFRIPILFAAE